VGSTTVPLWLLIALVVLSTWALLDRLLIPSVRWYLHRRVNRAIDQINTRLNIHIRPFQLTKRQVLIDRLAYDPKVIEALHEYAQQRNVPRDVAQAEVLRYAREIVPAFNAYVYFRVGYWLARGIARLLYRVRAGFKDPMRLSQVDPHATVVFVMNHRSNMDYVLVAFLAAEQSALSYAVGEWARIWPLQHLIRMMGAFFVRRQSNDPLYRRVLERYVHMATDEGVCQAVFLEGKLSRDGRLQSPRFGILDYMLREHDLELGRDIVFVPVGINFDRVIEDRTLLRSLDAEAPPRSFWFVLHTTFGFIGHNLWQMARNRWLRFGHAAVHFGRPVSVREYAQARRLDFRRMTVDARHSAVERLAHELMETIRELIPVTPVPIAAATLLQAGPAGISEFDWKAGFHAFAEETRKRGSFVIAPSARRAHAFAGAVHMLRLRRLVVEDGELYRAAPGAEALLAYYANSIVMPAVPEELAPTAAS
jgi:glycerol-3-phosphate O-acyltransferase